MAADPSTTIRFLLASRQCELNSLRYCCEAASWWARSANLAALLGLDAAPAITPEEHEQLYLQGYLAALRTDESRLAGCVPLLPASAPLDAAKRLMLEGMLAGLFARTWLPGDNVLSPSAADLNGLAATNAGAQKETRQLAFDLSGQNFSYEAGDALGVWPTNCPICWKRCCRFLGSRHRRR